MRKEVENRSRPRGYPVAAPIRAATVRERFLQKLFRHPVTAHGFPTVMLGVPMLNASETVAGGTTAGLNAAGLAVPPRVATIPATAPPATAAATTIHFRRLKGPAEVVATPPLGSATYWKETMTARACSLDARIRI